MAFLTTCKADEDRQTIFPERLLEKDHNIRTIQESLERRNLQTAVICTQVATRKKDKSSCGTAEIWVHIAKRARFDSKGAYAYY
ncbi:MAG: hypothetical protein A2Y60_06605 [Chloroflexi bacterium RBG_13_54_9]|nr:MAG: hypothetical protein A2Y60_06605 [Chloroflexi bacterium RBG_13_54_9]